MKKFDKTKSSDMNRVRKCPSSVTEPAMKLQHLRLECSVYPQTCDVGYEKPMAQLSLREIKPRLSGYCGFQIKDQNGCAVQEASLNFTPEEVAAIEAIAKKALQRVVKDTCGGFNARRNLQ